MQEFLSLLQTDVFKQSVGKFRRNRKFIFKNPSVESFLTRNGKKSKIPLLENYESFRLHSDLCKPYKNPLKVLEYDYLKNICQSAQFPSSYSRKRDRTERMEQWYGNLPSSPTGRFIADLLLPCVKKKKKSNL